MKPGSTPSGKALAAGRGPRAPGTRGTPAAQPGAGGPRRTAAPVPGGGGRPGGGGGAPPGPGPAGGRKGGPGGEPRGKYNHASRRKRPPRYRSGGASEGREGS